MAAIWELNQQLGRLSWPLGSALARPLDVVNLASLVIMAIPIPAVRSFPIRLFLTANSDVGLVSFGFYL